MWQVDAGVRWKTQVSCALLLWRTASAHASTWAEPAAECRRRKKRSARIINERVLRTPCSPLPCGGRHVVIRARTVERSVSRPVAVQYWTSAALGIEGASSKSRPGCLRTDCAGGRDVLNVSVESARTTLAAAASPAVCALHTPRQYLRGCWPCRICLMLRRRQS